MLCLGDIEQGEPGVRLAHNARKLALVHSGDTLGPEQGGAWGGVFTDLDREKEVYRLLSSSSPLIIMRKLSW
jgi:hypothetical protein